MRVHISLNSSSLDDSIAFYAALFGQEATKTREDYANFRLDQPAIHLALVERESAFDECNGIGHLGVELPDAGELQAWRGRLEDSGVAFDVEDEAQCCYAQADKLWLTDPDGNRYPFSNKGLLGTTDQSGSAAEIVVPEAKR